MTRANINAAHARYSCAHTPETKPATRHDGAKEE